MDFFFRFVTPWILWITIPLFLLTLIVRRFVYKPVYFRYSLGAALQKGNVTSNHIYSYIFYAFNCAVLFILALLIAQPQIVDSRSKIDVHGIDIMLVLDASGSMQMQDYSNDKRSRFDVAKEEAIRFIKKRTNDAIGLVLFARFALSRAPLTLDKKMLEKMVSETKLGELNPEGTVLGTGMLTAINRLKHSKAKSKIMILLTDGEPSEGDTDPKSVSAIAKKLGIKVYTIGIGSEKDEMIMHPFYGLLAKPKVNKALLDQIAHDTGGQSFMAHNADDMRQVYDTIDSLEKTEHEMPIFTRYYDLLTLLGLAILVLISIQLFLQTFVWFAI